MTYYHDYEPNDPTWFRVAAIRYMYTGNHLFINFLDSDDLENNYNGRQRTSITNSSLKRLERVMNNFCAEIKIEFDDRLPTIIALRNMELPY